MADQLQNSRYKEVLDELQLQSWQLELVISGFAIFGLFSALEPLLDWVSSFSSKGLYLFRYLGFAIYFSCVLTITNLLLHVLLRSLWIGAVGIRSVSGEIDFDKLNFNSYTTKYLKERIGSFDFFIEKLERYSSVMFGLTFLVVFMTFGVFINFVLFLFLTDSILGSELSESWKWVLAVPVYFILFIFYIFILLDFLTRGAIKRLAGKWYLPIYRFTSILTLSVLYRPLLYNLWDNEFGKKLTRWLLPVYLLSIFIFSSTYISTNYFSNFYYSSSQFAARNNYLDMVKEKESYIDNVAIPSKTISTPFLEININYDMYFEALMFEYDATLIPKKPRIGWKPFVYSWFKWEFGDSIKKNEEVNFLKAINESLVTRIDSLVYNEEFVVSEEKDGNSCLKKYIDISQLRKGKHLLTIQRRTSKIDSTKLEHYESIPFWYFPD